MIYIIVALVFYTAALPFLTAASRSLNTNLATGIINTLSAIIPVVAVIPILSKKVIVNHKFGILAAVLAGICIAIFGMALTKSFSFNKVGIVAPIVFGGAIFFSTILSVVIFKEKLTLIEGAGLAVLFVGFVIIIYARAVAE